MDKTVKKMLLNAVTSGTLKNVQSVFNEHVLELDDSFFDYELLKAALIKKDISLVNFLLKFGCRVKNPNKDGVEETAIHLAMKLTNRPSSNYEVISKLIDQGASLNDKNDNGETPLCAAFKEGYLDNVHKVLTNYKNMSNANPANNNNFHIACITNHSFAVENFLKCGFNPNTASSLDVKKYSGFNAIEIAIENNQFKLFKILLKYNSDFSIKNAKELTPLHMIFYSSSIKNKESWIIQAFKAKNDKIFTNAEDKYGVTHFHLCCKFDEPNFVQTFIDRGVNINCSVSLECPSNAGFTPLHFAVNSGSAQVVELLLKHGADPNKMDNRGRTALHLVCYMYEQMKYLRIDIAEMLLQYKASPIIQDKKGCTALHKTFFYTDSEGMLMFETLMSKMQWESNNCTDDRDLSHFHIACSTNNVGQVKKFLNSGVNIDSCVSSGIYSGYTALHFAVMYNQKDVVEVLLKRNAKVNVKAGQSCVTPLHLATEFNYMKFDQKETVDKCPRLSYNPLNPHSTLSCTKQLDIIKLLLSHGADVDAYDAINITPLLNACLIDLNYCHLSWNCTSYLKEEDDLYKEISHRLKEIIEILVTNKADIKARSESESIFHILIQYNNLLSDTLIEFLVDSGADINAADVTGLTPLHLAVEHNNKKLVRSLLKNNANPNIKCKNSKIPLHVVFEIIVHTNGCHSQLSEKDIFCALLEYGSDVNMSYPNGRTMLKEAISEYKYCLISYLLNYGADINIGCSSGCSALCGMSEWDYREYHPDEALPFNVDARLFQIIFIHVKKLLALGLPVSRAVQNDCTRSYVRYKMNSKLKNLDSISDMCIQELDRMKNIKLNSYTSLYHTLFKDPHELAKYVKNSSYIKIVEDIYKDFPLYGNLVKIQFTRGVIRSRILQSAEAALNNVLNIKLSDMCSDFVFKYLENKDIVNLKAAELLVKHELLRKLPEDNLCHTDPSQKNKKKRARTQIQFTDRQENSRRNLRKRI